MGRRSAGPCCTVRHGEGGVQAKAKRIFNRPLSTMVSRSLHGRIALAMIFPSLSQLASKQITRTGRAEGCHQGRPCRNPAPSTSARSNGTTSSSTASTSSIAPWSAKERVLMLYFNTNVGATLGSAFLASKSWFWEFGLPSARTKAVRGRFWGKKTVLVPVLPEVTQVPQGYLLLAPRRLSSYTCSYMRGPLPCMNGMKPRAKRTCPNTASALRTHAQLSSLSR